MFLPLFLGEAPTSMRHFVLPSFSPFFRPSVRPPPKIAAKRNIQISLFLVWWCKIETRRGLFFCIIKFWILNLLRNQNGPEIPHDIYLSVSVFFSNFAAKPRNVRKQKWHIGFFSKNISHLAPFWGPHCAIWYLRIYLKDYF